MENNYKKYRKKHLMYRIWYSER